MVIVMSNSHFLWYNWHKIKTVYCYIKFYNKISLKNSTISKYYISGALKFDEIIDFEKIPFLKIGTKDQTKQTKEKVKSTIPIYFFNVRGGLIKVIR